MDGRITTVLLVTVVAAASTAVACRTETDELVELIALDGRDYTIARDTLVHSRTEPWDLRAALKVSWDAGLAAHVLDVRRAHPELFPQWDAVVPQETIIRDHYSKHPASFALCSPGNSPEDEARSAFLVEQIWKTAAVPDWKVGALVSFSCLRVSGPVELWLAVWEGATDPALRAVALHGVAQNLTPGLRPVVVAALGDPTMSPEILAAAFNGLGDSRSPEALDLVLEFIPVWERDREILWFGFKALDALTIPAARRALLATWRIGTTPTRSGSEHCPVLRCGPSRMMFR